MWGDGVAGEPHASGANAGSIVMTCCHRWEWYELRDACWACGHVAVHPMEVIKGVVDAFMKGDTGPGGLGERGLHAGKNVARAQ